MRQWDIGRPPPRIPPRLTRRPPEPGRPSPPSRRRPPLPARWRPASPLAVARRLAGGVVSPASWSGPPPRLRLLFSGDGRMTFDLEASALLLAGFAVGVAATVTVLQPLGSRRARRPCCSRPSSPRAWPLSGYPLPAAIAAVVAVGLALAHDIRHPGGPRVRGTVALALLAGPRTAFVRRRARAGRDAPDRPGTGPRAARHRPLGDAPAPADAARRRPGRRARSGGAGHAGRRREPRADGRPGSGEARAGTEAPAPRRPAQDRPRRPGPRPDPPPTPRPRRTPPRPRPSSAAYYALLNASASRTRGRCSPPPSGRSSAVSTAGATATPTRSRAHPARSRSTARRSRTCSWPAIAAALSAASASAGRCRPQATGGPSRRSRASALDSIVCR